MAKINDEKFFVAPNREVKLLAGQSSVFNILKEVTEPEKVHLIYEDETSLNIKSDYENPVDIGGNKFLNLASLMTNGFVPSGQFAVQGYQIWKQTDVLEFSLNLQLHMVDSGLNQVVIPALALSKLCVPAKKNEKDPIWGQSLVPPGPSLKTFLAQAGINIKVDDSENYAQNGIQGNPLHVQIGRFLKIDNVVMTKVEPTFSEVLDEDYMPVSCSLAIDFRTVEVVTTNMLDQMIKFAQGN